MHVRIFLILILLFCGVTFGSPLLAQNGGQISGIVVDEAGVVLEKASVRLFSITDSTQSRLQLSGKEGEFYFSEVAWGWHAIEITFSGLKKIRVDSLHVRSEKELFSLGNITLKPSTDNQLTEVIIDRKSVM